VATSIRLMLPSRSTSAPGQKLKWVCLIGVSASRSKTDMRRLQRHVGFVPTADISGGTQSVITRVEALRTKQRDPEQSASKRLSEPGP
jgi:hypothetical protein